MSTKLLDDSNLDLLIPSPTQASWQALAFCRTPRVRALGAPRAHVLHARAPSRRVSLPPPRARSGHSPLTASTTAPSLTAEPSLELHSAAVRSAPVASGRPQWVPATDGAARATRVRQLPSGAVRAHPQARLQALVAATSPLQQQNGGSPSFLSNAAEPT